MLTKNVISDDRVTRIEYGAPAERLQAETDTAAIHALPQNVERLIKLLGREDAYDILEEVTEVFGPHAGVYPHPSDLYWATGNLPFTPEAAIRLDRVRSRAQAMATLPSRLQPMRWAWMALKPNTLYLDTPQGDDDYDYLLTFPSAMFTPLGTAEVTVWAQDGIELLVLAEVVRAGVLLGHITAPIETLREGLL